MVHEKQEPLDIDFCRGGVGRGEWGRVGGVGWGG